MSKKHHGGPGPVPPANKSHSGPKFSNGPLEEEQPGQDRSQAADGAASPEQAPKNRMGNFVGTGEHSIEQPDGKNGANH